MDITSDAFLDLEAIVKEGISSLRKIFQSCTREPMALSWIAQKSYVPIKPTKPVVHFYGVKKEFTIIVTIRQKHRCCNLVQSKHGGQVDVFLWIAPRRHASRP